MTFSFTEDLNMFQNQVSKCQTRFLFCCLDTSWDRGAKIGEGFHDVGPKDVGQEIFAKMEEAAQHALAIIEGAKKFTEEAEKEQSVKSKSKNFKLLAPKRFK